MHPPSRDMAHPLSDGTLNAWTVNFTNDYCTWHFFNMFSSEELMIPLTIRIMSTQGTELCKQRAEIVGAVKFFEIH